MNEKSAFEEARKVLGLLVTAAQAHLILTQRTQKEVGTLKVLDEYWL